MYNFEYYNPVKIIFGKGTIAQLTDLIPVDRKVMMIYGGGSIRKNGVYDQVQKALQRHQWVEFGGIEVNPLHETCMLAVEKVKSEHVDFLLAAGGGSVLDATKYIAAAVKFTGEDPWEILRTAGAVVEGALPLGDVLTLPATGSEMNKNSVISRKSSQEKLPFINPHVFPRFSILDPETTYSLPQKQLRNGIVDTFSHVMEQYMTYNVNAPLQDRQAEAILNTLVEIAPRIKEGVPDYDARASFMWAATQALNGVISCGVAQDWTTHDIGHELTAFYGIDHAESLAVVMPAVWRHQKEYKKEKLAQYAERVWGMTAGTVEEKADKAIEKTIEFFHSLNMPTRLADYGIMDDGIEKIIRRFTERNVALGEHQQIHAPEAGEILQLCK